MDYIYLRAGRVRLRGWGVQNKFEQKSRGVKANHFFFYKSPSGLLSFSNERVRQEGGMIQAN